MNPSESSIQDFNQLPSLFSGISVLQGKLFDDTISGNNNASHLQLTSVEGQHDLEKKLSSLFEINQTCITGAYLLQQQHPAEAPSTLVLFLIVEDNHLSDVKTMLLPEIQRLNQNLLTVVAIQPNSQNFLYRMLRQIGHPFYQN